MSYKSLTLKKSLSKYSISDRDFLNKRLKTSTRYSKVKSKTNSGFNATRKQELEKEIKKYYKVSILYLDFLIYLIFFLIVSNNKL